MESEYDASQRRPPDWTKAANILQTSCVRGRFLRNPRRLTRLPATVYRISVSLSCCTRLDRTPLPIRQTKIPALVTSRPGFFVVGILVAERLETPIGVGSHFLPRLGPAGGPAAGPLGPQSPAYQPEMAWPISSGASSWTKWRPLTVTSRWLGQPRQNSRCSPTRIAPGSPSMGSCRGQVSVGCSGPAKVNTERATLLLSLRCLQKRWLCKTSESK